MSLLNPTCDDCGGPLVQIWATLGFLQSAKIEVCQKDLKRALGRGKA